MIRSAQTIKKNLEVIRTSCDGCNYKNKKTEVNSTWNYVLDSMDCKGLYDSFLCKELQELEELKRRNEINKYKLDCWKPLLDRQKIIGY